MEGVQEMEGMPEMEGELRTREGARIGEIGLALSQCFQKNPFLAPLAGVPNLELSKCDRIQG